MAKKLDLRKTTTAPNPPAVVAAQQPLPSMPLGGLPMEAGTVLNLSKTEREQLEALNWKDGEPVPNVADMIERIRQDAESNRPDPNMPMPAMPKEIDIRTLPLEKQQQLQAAAAKMIEDDKRLQAIQAQHVANPSCPAVNDAINQLVGGQDQFQIVPPTEQPKKAAPAQAPETGSQQDPTPEGGMQTMANGPLFCKNCNQDIDKDPIEVTDDDKKGFLAMMVGGAQFAKEYPLFGGKVTVVFRALSHAELDMAVTQGGHDTRDGKVPNSPDFFRVVQNYEMALALRQIRTQDSSVVDFPAIEDVEVDLPELGEPQQTKLKEYGPHVFEQIGSASMFRLVSAIYARFYTLTRRMEANSFNADFWTGIETPA